MKQQVPLPLPKADSSSTMSVSSIDNHSNSSSSGSNSAGTKGNEYAYSRRLVDYFVVFTTKLPKKEKEMKDKKSQDHQSNDNDNDTNHNDNGDNNNKNNNNNQNKETLSLSPSAKNHDILERRMSTRAIHLKDHFQGGSSDSKNTGSTSFNIQKIDSTPKIGHKSILSPTTDSSVNCTNIKNANENVISSSQVMSFRVPVTNDKSLGSDADSDDVDTTNDDIYIMDKTSTLSFNHEYEQTHYDNDDQNDDSSDDDDNNRYFEEDFITPSRIGSSEGKECDDDVVDDVINNVIDDFVDKKDSVSENDDSSREPNHKYNDNASDLNHQIEPMISTPPAPLSTPQIKENSGVKQDREGASENIHMPTFNGVNSTKGKSNQSDNIYLTPVQTARYPPSDHHDAPFNPMTTHFCFPHGQEIQFTTEYVMPRIHYFVLTNDRGKKMYGTCLTIYEEFEFDKKRNNDKDNDSCNNGWVESDFKQFYRNDDVLVDEANNSESSIEVSLEYADILPPLYHPKVICILSSWPYLHAFKVYLSQLYRLATMTNLMTCPIERYVLNICDEVPAPPPGMFEMRLQILDSTIRFWAPPAKQPIPYVSIPFNVLFECLDLNNVLFVWYALTLEHKVLLVSSQNSLLTLCAEIFCALLFPLEWPHLYIPILPPFLSPMLDAPFPYLCGITRENFRLAIKNVNEETIVVDLDQNLITKGEYTPSFPPMPLRRRSKIEMSLQNNVGDVFWLARGVTKKEVEDLEVKGGPSSTKGSSDITKTIRIWRERLQSYDDAFNLAFTPDSETLLHGNKETIDLDDGVGQSKWDVVQETFLSYFATMLRDYKRFIDRNNATFRTKDFLKSQRQDFKPFLKVFLDTQLFDSFITKVLYSPHEPDILFFNQSITAKKNRSKMTLKKKRTPFLHSAKARKQLRTIDASKPSAESNLNLLDHFYGTSEARKFSYAKWPEKLNQSLLRNPRNIPDVIAAEFDRRAGKKLYQEEMIVDLDDFHVTSVSSSIEVTTFTLFFLLSCELVGKELQIIRNQYLPQAEHILNERSPSKSLGRLSDCGNLCAFGKSTSSVTVNQEYTAAFKSYAMSQHDQLAGFATEVIESEIETAKTFALAELDLAFSTLETLFMRKLTPSIDALKSLMTACGRCDCSERASKLMSMIYENGVYIDSETYYYFCMNAPIDDQKHRKDWFMSRTNPINMVKSSKKKRREEYQEGSEHSSYSGAGYSFQEIVSNLPTRNSTAHKREKTLTMIQELCVTDQVERHINIGEALLTYLYKDIEIDTDHSTCQSCGAILHGDKVRLGWHDCSFIDNYSECIYCKNTFVPSFVVKTTEPTFMGSQGIGTPLHCEFLSPWVLHKEIHIATRDSSFKEMLDPQWRNDGDKNATIWWNLVISFRRHKLPITFLLQGSFRERLIMPMSD